MRPRLSLKNRCIVQTLEEDNGESDYIKNGAMLQTFYTNKMMNKDKLIATRLRRLGTRRSSVSPKRLANSSNPDRLQQLIPTINVI